MELLFLVIVFIIIIALESILDNWIIIAVIGSLILGISIIRQIKECREYGFDFNDFMIFLLKIIGIAGLFGIQYLLK